MDNCKQSLKLAVLSDLHVCDRDDASISYISLESQDSITTNPFYGLNHLIEKQQLSADIVICPGDLCDKASHHALKYAWRQLQLVKTNLGAKYLFATAGNHDMDSFLQTSKYDAKGLLQSLSPQFPFDCDIQFNKYWSLNYAISEHENVRFLNLNSAAYHGYGKELDHGRVSPNTLARIEQELISSKPFDKNVLICHHHPHKHGEIELDDYSNMINGERLIDMLGSGKYGNWLIVHGHKHHPRVCYGSNTGGNAPVVFSAGSFSAALYDELQTKVRNQFYILDLELNLNDNPSLYLPGSFTSWDWIQYTGWQIPGTKSGLPHKGGFGANLAIKSLAEDIAAHIKNESVPYYSWPELKLRFSELKYMLPVQQENLIQFLKNLDIECLYDQDHQVAQLGSKRC